MVFLGRKNVLFLFFMVALMFVSVMAGGKELIFKETIIEGKIKRPQVVLISANSRPVFGPMAINSYEDSTELINTISSEIFEQRQFESAIKLEFK